MLIAATKLYHLPILDPDTHDRLGIIRSIIFDPDTGKLVALEIKTSGVLKTIQYIAAVDINAFENHAVLCSEESLNVLSELPRIRDVLTARRPILGQTVVTVTKKPLGKVKEVLFDDISYRISQIHVHHLFDRRIIPFDQIVRVTTKNVVVKEEMAVETETVPAEATTAVG